MDAIQRGQRAKQLLEDDLLVEMLQVVHDGCIEMWKNATTPQDRENAWHALRGADLFVGLLRGCIGKGEAKAAAEEQEERVDERT